MSGKSVWELIKQTALSWDKINAPRLGAALAFYTLLSVAPLLVVSIGIAGMVFGQDEVRGHLAYQVQMLIGPQGGRAVLSLLESASQPAAGLAATTVGFLTLLWGASGVFGELRDSLNSVWGVQTNSASGIMGIVRQRFISFAMVLGIGFLLLVSLVLSALIAIVGKFFHDRFPMPEGAMQFGTMAVSFIAITLLFALLYKFVPEVHIEWQDVAIGAAVTSLLFSIGKTIIGLYLGKASVGSAYGAAGSVVVFIVWVYYSAQIFFLGAQFTRVYSERHGSRAQRWAARHAKRHHIQQQPKLA